MRGSTSSVRKPAASLAGHLGIQPSAIFTALVAMESQGTILRGNFEHDATMPDTLVIPTEAEGAAFPPVGATTVDVSDQGERAQQLAPQAHLPQWQIEWCERRLLQRIHK